MSGHSSLIINGKPVRAGAGKTLLDAGLEAGIVIPQDCCTGQCETCRVDLVAGAVDAMGTEDAGTVLACQARVTGDAEIRFDPVPIVRKTGGTVTAIRDLGGDIVEVVVEVTRPVPYLPGQYVKVAFGAFPARDYSPTLTLDGLREINQLIFQIRRMDDGIVSGALGSAIRPGTKAKVSGPYGSAFLRQGEGRLVLVSTGTGFAPIWSIAVAARLGQPHRPVTVIASVRDPRNLYMRPAFDWLTKQGVNDLVLAASGANPLPPARHGRAIAFLPRLLPSDTIFVAGAPEVVAAVRAAANAAGAKCHADPFLPSSNKPSLRMKIASLFRGAPKKVSPVHAQIETLEANLGRQKG
jgi:3-phenylpropionate/trans-cinnamate dioxygenase ferredoxin reductase subunit